MMEENFDNNSLCAQLKEDRELFLKKLIIKSFEAFPDIEIKYGKNGVERTKEDLNYHLEHLTAAVCLNDKNLFLDYAAWLKMFFTSINLPVDYQKVPFSHIKETAEELFSDRFEQQLVSIVNYVLERYDALPAEQNSFISENNKLNIIAQQYMNSLLRKERTSAERIILNQMQTGANIKEIYLYVFQPVQWEIGRLWQMNKISVAMEHYFTAATQFIMSRLYEYIFTTKKNGRNLIAASVSGELHELGIRMVADFFEIEGWNTFYLGANTPVKSISQMIKETGSEVLAISATIAFNIPKVKSLISELRNEFDKTSLKIIVGGKAFNSNPELWQNIGADGYAVDAAEAITLANRLLKVG
ncbi:MAG: cobalamin-dependent protein [Melioribacteraceae bacterium]|nr:cobalamin-dependent protein [Melioribacteraceae bacterium]